MNVASISSFSPNTKPGVRSSLVSGSAISDSTKLNAAGAGLNALSADSILSLPSKSLVGFLSLLNRILDPSEASTAPTNGLSLITATSQPAKQRTVATLSRSANEGGRPAQNDSRTLEQSAERLQLALNQPQNQFAIPAVPIAIGRTKIPEPELARPAAIPQPQSAGGFLESGGYSSATRFAEPRQPEGPVSGSAAQVAFAIRLTPQIPETESAPLPELQSSTNTQPDVQTVFAPPSNSRIVKEQSQFTARGRPTDPPQPSPPYPEHNTREPRESAQKDAVETAAPQASEPAPRSAEPIAVPKPIGEVLWLPSDVDKQSIVAAESARPESSHSDASPQNGRDGSALPVELGTDRTTARHQRPAASSNVSLKPQAMPFEEQDSSDREPNGRAIKLGAPEKPATNEKDIYAQDATGFVAVPQLQASGADRASPRTEPAPADSLEIESNLSLRPQPIHEISLQLGENSSNQVDIQVVERAGKVQVAVRTTDQELTKSLQTNLGELVGRMEEKGYKTETWIPAATLHGNVALHGICQPVRLRSRSAGAFRALVRTRSTTAAAPGIRPAAAAALDGPVARNA